MPSWSISEAATLRLFFAHRSLTAIVFLQCRSQEVDSTASRAVSKQLTYAPFITSQKKRGGQVRAAIPYSLWIKSPELKMRLVFWDGMSCESVCMCVLREASKRGSLAVNEPVQTVTPGFLCRSKGLCKFIL